MRDTAAVHSTVVKYDANTVDDIIPIRRKNCKIFMGSPDKKFVKICCHAAGKGVDWKKRPGGMKMAVELWQMLGFYLACVNLAAFGAMWADKRRARRGRWRLSEKTLFLFPVLGGALGGLLGMQVFRHKTRHWYFRWGFVLLAILQLAGMVWLVRNQWSA